MPLQLQILGLPYALFLAAAVGVYWASPQRTRPAVLVLFSLFFYASSSPACAVFILGLAVLVHAVAEVGAGRRLLCMATVGLCVASLAYFKYARWLLGPKTYLVVIVPLGISFFTFEFIHYLVDAYRGFLPRNDRRGLLDFLAFALFFPTLLAGPIKRYQQFQAAPRWSSEDAAYGLFRMLLGLGKKVLIADTVAGLATRLAIPDQVTPLGLWIAMYAYALQIYCDFSGYSDLAIGAGRLFGYRVPENFDWPYISTSLPEFWRRWHISLSTWIRDYLFIPIGGSRGTLVRRALNLLLVMALCGLWHGAAWHFVAWGVWHGAGLAVTAVFSRRSSGLGPGSSQKVGPARLAAPSWRRLIGLLLTFHFVCFGWVLFAAPSLDAAATAFGRMLGLAAK